MYQDGAFLAVGDATYDEKPTAAPQPTELVTRAAVTGDQRLHWPPLAATETELEELEKAAGQRKLVKLTGEQASTLRVLAELPKARWAHFATHGFFADLHRATA